MKKETYWDKKKVYGDNPLTEIIYELEDMVFVSDILGGKFIDYYKAQEILQRHRNTVEEYKNRNKK